ncbi:DNA polymerase III subunit delta [Gammaproteobacteria bacterium]
MHPEQLEQHLKGRLAPIYLFAGDEILLVEEAGDQVRIAARRSGCGEREIFHAVQGFDWNSLTRSGANLSLFSTRRLWEIRLPTAKPGVEGGKILTALASHPPADTVILIFCPRLDAATQKSAWLTSVERAGVLVIMPTVERAALPGWIAARMRSRGLIPDPDAARLLAERVEGNLLAGAQEIEKLRLLLGKGTVDADTVEAAVADSARFDVYVLADACLAGDPTRAVRILMGLRREGTELPLILWALTRELRTLAGLAVEVDRGVSAERALSGVWERRRPLMIRALRRLGTRGSEDLLRQSAQVDRHVKGSLAGDPWGEMFGLVAKFSGGFP